MSLPILPPDAKVKNVTKDLFNAQTLQVADTQDALIRQGLDYDFTKILKIFTPPDRELTPDEAGKYFNEKLQELDTHIKAGKGFPPVLIGVLVAIGISSLMAFLSPMLQPLADKSIGQPSLAKHTPTIPQPDAIISGYFRGIITGQQASEALSKLGYSPQFIQMLLNLYFFIPSAGDIIRFGVREVYRPEIVASYRALEGFDSLWAHAEQDARKAGLTKETFQKYWASHWELPSPLQGFEMLHRGIINRTQLLELLTTLDFMPAWRERLMELSFNPYTRVDVRRMHLVGILKDADLIKTYKDLGYDDEHAKNMADFTIAYNQDVAENEKRREDKERDSHKDLTRGDILKSYRLELLTAQDATSLLKDIKYDDATINFLLSREDYLRELEYQDATIEIIHSGYVKGSFEWTQARSQLGQLALPAKYMDRLFYLWDIEKSARNVMPTKSELLGFLKSGLINELTCRTELEKLGYNTRYIEWYIQGVKGKTAPATQEE